MGSEMCIRDRHELAASGFAWPVRQDTDDRGLGYSKEVIHDRSKQHVSGAVKASCGRILVWRNC